MANLDRDTIVMHLEDLRVLEITKAKLTGTIKKLNERINQLGISNAYRSPDFGSIMEKSFIVVFAIIVGYTLFFRASLAVIINNIEIWLIVLIIIFVISTIIQYVIIAQKKKLFISQDTARVEKENIEKAKLETELYEAKSKYKEANILLSSAYSANIVPLQFRNLQGICYLYDYMSTSQEPLTSAFINYNVNNVNIRLDKIIEQQAEQIEQQYITNAKLDRGLKDNQRMISLMNSIDRNSTEAAQYNKISSTHLSSMDFYARMDYYNSNK